MKRMLLWTAALCVASAIDASAQSSGGNYNGFLTGHVGAVTGGDLSEPRAAAGVSVAVHEQNGWGAEIDFSHAADATAGRQVLDLTSYMVNAIWMRPDGLIRPFGTGGAGVLQVNGCDAPCTVPARTYDLGFSAGGGAFVTLNDVAALRADVRYFWASANHPDLRRPDNMNYWRFSFGATFMWALAP